MFSLADSLEQCCSMPNIAGGRPHELTNCSSCGGAFAVPPCMMVTSPCRSRPCKSSGSSQRDTHTSPHTGTGGGGQSLCSHHMAYQWYCYACLSRLSLEMFSKRLLLVNTTSEDGGVYEADVYPIGGGPPLVVQFTVLLPPVSTPLHCTDDCTISPTL